MTVYLFTKDEPNGIILHNVKSIYHLQQMTMFRYYDNHDVIRTLTMYNDDIDHYDAIQIK